MSKSNNDSRPAYEVSYTGFDALAVDPSLAHVMSGDNYATGGADGQGPTAADGLYWYKCRVESAGSFSTPDMADCAWLLQRATRQVYFQDGLLADVTSAYGGVFETVQPTSRSIGEEIYFTLPEWFPSAEDAPREMLQHAPFPEEYSSPESSSDATHDPFSSNPWTSATDAYNYARTSSKTRGDSECETFNFLGEGSCRNKLIWLLSTVLIVGLGVLALWGNLAICMAIGKTSDHWAFVFLWLCLGFLVYCPIYGIFVYLLAYNIGGERCHAYDDEVNHPICKAITMPILLFVFGMSFGAPLAWTEAQVMVGDKYLATDKLKTLNCWRNPQDTFEQVGHHFIVFEEAEWTVDYKTRQNQGVKTLMGTGDDDTDNGNRYNFCLAPMRYNGLPECPQNFYAACFRETSQSYLASCDDNDAKTCGWDFPSPMNLIRTMNRNEQFWSGVEEEDETLWTTAKGYMTPFVDPSVAKSNVIGFYSGEGPAEITAYVDKADNLSDALFISCMSIFAGIAFIMMLFTNCVCDDC